MLINTFNISSKSIWDGLTPPFTNNAGPTGMVNVVIVAAVSDSADPGVRRRRRHVCRCWIQGRHRDAVANQSLAGHSSIDLVNNYKRTRQKLKIINTKLLDKQVNFTTMRTISTAKKE